MITQIGAPNSTESSVHTFRNIHPEHIEELYKWRKSILESNFFVDAKGSPVSLLTAYKNNLKLIEAAYLIVVAYRNGYQRYGVAKLNIFIE